jgi:beta-glucosidase
MPLKMPRTISPFARWMVPGTIAGGALFCFALPGIGQTPIEEPTFQTPSNQGVAVEAPTPRRSPAPAQVTGAEKRTPDSASTPFNRNPGRHQQFLERAKIGKLDLLFLGDSILDRMPKVGEWTWLRFAPDNPADFAVDGERTDDVLWRVENGELDGIAPKVAVLLIGTNNFGLYKTEQPEWVAAGVKKIVETIHTKLPTTKVLVLAIFPRGTADDALRTKIEATNVLLAKLDDGKTTRYLDFGKKFLDDKGNIPPDVMRDKLHPTAKGYEIWWEAMHPLLAEMLTAPVATPTPTPSPSVSATPAPKPSATPGKGAKPK